MDQQQEMPGAREEEIEGTARAEDLEQDDAAGEARDPRLIEIQRKMIAAGLKILYAKSETTAKIVAMVRDAGDPAEGVAQATVLVLEQLKQQIKGLPPQAAYLAATVLAVFVAELAVKAGVIPDEGAIVGDAIQQIKEMGAQLNQSGDEQPAGPAADPAAQAPDAAQGAAAAPGAVAQAMEGAVQ